MYFLDVVTSPVAWTSFGLGLIVSALAVLITVKLLPPTDRPHPLIGRSTPIVAPDGEWESTTIAGCWLNVTHRVSISPFYIHVVNETTQHTETGYLTHDQAQSLATWILDHLRGVPK
jgi:hypothetical protein